MNQGKRFGRGVRRVPGQMNKLEEAYGKRLWERKLAGEVLWYAFDSLKLRLADTTFYTPDYLVMLASDVLEIHEVKGHWEDDARVKIKVAADKFPFPFVAIQRKQGLWVEERF